MPGSSSAEAWPARSGEKAARRSRPECDRIGGTFVGGAVITTGGKLKARHVIHAVGPRMGEGDEDGKLRDATVNSLKLADEHSLKSLAFPAISTGIFGFPIERCAEIMLDATIEHLRGDTGLDRVVFCLFGRDSYEVFAGANSNAESCRREDGGRRFRLTCYLQQL